MLMNRTQVEVRFTDKLDSIRVDQREMEIPNAIKEKPIEEWFEATTGRVKWGGLGAEIKDMDFSGEKNAAYSFLFNGPEDKKREFMICVQSYGLGEEAQKESKKETVQEYLKDAENLHQMGNEEAAFLRYKIAAEEYGDAHAQYKLARWYQDGIGCLFGWQVCCIPVGIGTVLRIRTVLRFIFPAEDKTVMFYAVEM